MMILKQSVKIRRQQNLFILFDTETELLHETNKVGYEIIKLLNGKNQKEDIQRALISKFKDIGPDKIKMDVEEFIKKLEIKNLIEIIPEKVTEKIWLFKSEIGCFTYYIDDEKKVLIDAGVLVRKPVDLIVITHCHFDHILFLNELKKINKCEIVCSRKEMEAIEKLNEKVLLEKSPKKLISTKVDKVVKEGDVITTGKFNFKVLETPGHTDGSISLFEEKAKILFTGDAWFGKNYQGRWTYPSGSKIESERTLKRLKKLNPKILRPGHFDIVYF